MENINTSSATNDSIESSLKELLDKILNYFEKFIKTKEELSELEAKLNDYETINELVDITKDVFHGLCETIDEKLQSGGDDNYDELEKIVQKHEGEIRNHIRVEQQLKLYAESIQAKLDESEKTRTDMVEQTKTIINNVKRENEKLTEALKQRTEQNDALSHTLKSLEQANKDYKEKLQELPYLQERISNLEKQNKLTGSKQFVALKELSSHQSHKSHDIENTKKIDIDLDYSKVNAKPDSSRKSVKASGSTQYGSPMKFINRTLSNTPAQKTKEFVRVKVEVSDPKHRKELEALKNSYQKFYNPTKSQTRERNANSVSRTRELKSIYSIPLVTHSSNTSLIHPNHHLSHRDHMLTKLHQRSSSHGGRTRSRASLARLEEGL